MSRQKSKKIRGRRQSALRIMAWLVILLMLNTALNVAPLFRFQALRKVEREGGIDGTRVIWQQETHGILRGEKQYFLSANDDVALVSHMEFTWGYGWSCGNVYLLSRNTKDPISAKWIRSYSGNRYIVDENVLFLTGYVKSESVATVEYRLCWGNGTETVVEIPEESYIYDGDQRYYFHDESAAVELFAMGEDFAYHIIDIYAIAKDAQGNVLYEESIYKSY